MGGENIDTIFLGLLNVLVSFFSANIIIHYPNWTVLGWKKRGMFIFFSCLALYISVCYFLVFAALKSDMQGLQFFKIFASIPSMTLSFILYRRKKAAWQFAFLAASAYMYGLIGIGIGIYITDTFFASANSFLTESIFTIIVAVITLPLLLFLLKRLCNNPYMKQALIFWRFIWLLPTFFFAVTIMSSSYLRDNKHGGSFVFIRIVLYFALLLICYLFEKLIRQVAQAENAKLEKETLEQIDKMKTDLMQTVSHEMRTPLTVMSVYAELAVKEMNGGKITEQTISDLNTISNEALRLAGLAGSVLDVFKKNNSIEAKTAVDIKAMASQLAHLLTPLAKSRGISINLLLPDSLPDCWGSPNELTRVLWNIFDNAVRHTENGSITVSGKHITESGAIEITVADTGSGITPEHIKQIFERGFSSEQGSINQTTGLGLAFCKEIIEAHGGKINIESEMGKGTEVKFSLPAQIV